MTGRVCGRCHGEEWLEGEGGWVLCPVCHGEGEV
jgi:hypothetical protein